jgi:predicted metal-dependent hydrolase
MTPYTLIRSKRKTLALYIRDGRLEVRDPLRCPKSDIDKFVASKEKWLIKKLAQSSEQSAKRKNFSLNYGDLVTYRGREYPIAAKAGNRLGFDGEHFYMLPNLPPEQIKAACVQIYKILAKRDLPDRVFDFAKQMAVMPTAVKITSAKTRWGSCSSKKSLNFSWRLMLADDDVIDYVVVHELAHIRQMNHSAAFWAIVEDILPDYKERKVQLRVLQKRLATEDW